MKMASPKCGITHALYEVVLQREMIWVISSGVLVKVGFDNHIRTR